MPTTTEYLFSVGQYHQMERQGIIGPQDKVELIRGKVVPKMGIGDEHVACVNRLNQLLMFAAFPHAWPSIQNPLVLADSEPEPDVVLPELQNGKPRNPKPAAADALLVIEVAKTSYLYDKRVKISLYAENHIQESWLVNVDERVVEVYQQPDASGQYQRIASHKLGTGTRLPLPKFPGVSIAVDEILA
ncbi:MAG: Uma2 family endonuclease [Pirellulaceae bacterium]|nr:Uma2 family endonuclease [Pirellulaceae bacterium]